MKIVGVYKGNLLIALDDFVDRLREATQSTLTSPGPIKVNYILVTPKRRASDNA